MRPGLTLYEHDGREGDALSEALAGLHARDKGLRQQQLQQLLHDPPLRDQRLRESVKGSLRCSWGKGRRPSGCLVRGL